MSFIKAIFKSLCMFSMTFAVSASSMDSVRTNFLVIHL